MKVSDKYIFVNIREYWQNEEDKNSSEWELHEILAEFSCPQNPDVEMFLKKNAIDFTKKDQSVTYLVFSREDGELLGYFTIALKPLTIKGETVSNSVKRKLKRVSEFDEQTQSFTMAAYLLAQLGKSFANGAESRIEGTELLDLAWNVIEEMQYIGGGNVAFLETHNNEKLISFYQDNKFHPFDTRMTEGNMQEPCELIQMLRRV